MAKHEHGSMDISVQEKTYDQFIKISIRTTVAIIVALVLLAIVNG